MNCKYAQDVSGTALKDLVLYTYLPELWDIFSLVSSSSDLDAQGFITINRMGDYLADAKLDFITHREFWKVMGYFLQRRNEQIYKKRKARNGKSSSSYRR